MLNVYVVEVLARVVTHKRSQIILRDISGQSKRLRNGRKLINYLKLLEVRQMGSTATEECKNHF